jgi:hypothetical protein
VTDPEASCASAPDVDVNWTTSGQGTFKDSCSEYANRERSGEPEILETEEVETLAVTTGVWQSIPYPTFTYQWERCKEGTPVESELEEEFTDGERELFSVYCTNIEGATSPEYMFGTEDLGHTLRVAVTAHKRLGPQTLLTRPTPIIRELVLCLGFSWCLFRVRRGRGVPW